MPLQETVRYEISIRHTSVPDGTLHLVSIRVLPIFYKVMGLFSPWRCLWKTGWKRDVQTNSQNVGNR